MVRTSTAAFRLAALAALCSRVQADVVSCNPSHANGREVSYHCDGIDYFLGVPQACYDAFGAGRFGGCGLVVDIHGATMSGPMELANTNSRQLANEAGYAILAPSKPSGWWNPNQDSHGPQSH